MYTKEELNSHKINGKYPKEFLIKVLQDFYKEHGRSPNYYEMKICNGFPSYSTFQKQFGSWSNALKEARIKNYQSINAKYSIKELELHRINGKYSKDFLIKVLQDFYKEYGRSPTKDEMKVKNGYPSESGFKFIFGTWNNALKEAGIPLNQYQDHWQTGDEVCENCGDGKSKIGWLYKNEKRLCSSCYMKRNYKYGNLNPKSTLGLGFIGEKIVLNTLDSEKHCNIEESFNHSIDIYDNVYGKIDVKTSILSYYYTNSKNGIWSFKLNRIEQPENYFIIAFSQDRKNIEHVWVIPSEAEILQNKKKIGITNSKIGLSRVKQFEVGTSTFNETYHSMSLINCPVLRKT